MSRQTDHPLPSCRRCQVKFKRTYMLQDHFETSERHNICKCCTPRKDFPTCGDLKRHNDESVCFVCKREFDTIAAIEDHLKKSALDHPHCRQCNISFHSGNAFRRHVDSKYVHEWICQCCTPQQKWPSKDALDNHMASKPTCHACKRYFESERKLERHVNQSDKPHPNCDRCRMKFSSQTQKEQHLRESVSHNMCQCCSPAIDFKTAKKLQDHTQKRLDERQRAIDEQIRLLKVKQLEGSMKFKNYNGIDRSLINPVFQAALKVKAYAPTVNAIRLITGTELDGDVVEAIIQAAGRTIKWSDDPQIRAMRLKVENELAAKAKAAEASLFEAFKNLGYKCLSENEQRKGAKGASPDILFDKPVMICGQMCRWLEYKYFFGFKANPFIHPKNVQQFRKYAQMFGPGCAVFSLGFEKNHVDVPNMAVFHEGQVREFLKKEAILLGKDTPAILY